MIQEKKRFCDLSSIGRHINLKATQLPRYDQCDVQLPPLPVLPFVSL